jgi:hypothetical protein
MEEKSGIDDSSPGGLKLPSLWVRTKGCLYLPETQEKPHLHTVMLGGQAS